MTEPRIGDHEKNRGGFRMPFARLSLVLAVLLWGGAAGAGEPAGRVLRLQGEAVAAEPAGSRPLAAGDPVRAGDTLRTGRESRLEVRFADGMTLTLSDGAEMAVAAFSWSPDRAEGRAELALAAGAFLLETGAVGRLPDHPLTVRTPQASVGVRGTRFWGGPLDAPLAVLLLEGRVVVSNAAGAVELGTPGEGTSATDSGTAPRPPSFWGEARIRRAFETVSFR